MVPARRVAVASAALAVAVGLSGCGGASGGGPTAVVGAPSSGTTAPTGSAADIAFAQLMIPHHQQAIEMAELALEQASSDEVVELATQIKAAQDPEIEQMTQWLQSWGAPLTMRGSDESGMPGMDHSGMDMGGVEMAGVMSAEDMAALAAARGPQFDVLWLRMMIAHHEGALTMADEVLAATDNEQVAALAHAVLEGQQAEIDTMRQLLAG